MNCLLAAPEPHTFTGVPSSRRYAEERDFTTEFLFTVVMCYSLLVCQLRWISRSELLYLWPGMSC